MRHNRAEICLLVYIIHGFACKIVEPVKVLGVFFYNKVFLRLINRDNRFKKISSAVLNILSHGVQIR